MTVAGRETGPSSTGPDPTSSQDLARDREILAREVPRLTSALVKAATSSSGQLIVCQDSLADGPNRRFREPVELRVDLLVDRDAGLGLIVRIVPLSGPAPTEPVVRVVPTDATTMERLAAELDRIFRAQDGNPAVEWRFIHVSADASVPVDEDWVQLPTADDLLERLGRLSTGRGGDVAVALIDRPSMVVRLVPSGRFPELRVTGRLSPLIREAKGATWKRTWTLSNDPAAGRKVLDDVAVALASQDGGGTGDPDGLALRMESNAAARQATGAGGTALLVVIPTVVAGYVMYLSGWPQSGIVADLTRMANESTSDKSGFFGLVIMAACLVVGAIPAYVASVPAHRVVDRLRLRYARSRAITTLTTLGVYAAWVAAMLFTPAWSILAGGLFALLGALLVIAIIRSHFVAPSRRSR